MKAYMDGDKVIIDGEDAHFFLGNKGAALVYSALDVVDKVQLINFTAYGFYLGEKPSLVKKVKMFIRYVRFAYKQIF